MTLYLASLRDGTLLADDAPPLPWWSFSKTVLAALMVEAEARSQLDLDAPCPGRAWTLRDLLEHRAGLGDYGGLPAYRAAVAARGAPWSTGDFLAAVPPDRPEAPPRSHFRYSNIGYLLARQALEDATGQGFGALVDGPTARLGLTRTKLAETADDFAGLPFDSGGYHPGWVAHGCLIGPPSEAAQMLHALFTDPALASMQHAHDLPFHDPARPWTRTGYGLGMMIGEVGAAGRALGHSGVGPFSVCAVYAFPDCPGTPVVAAFGPGASEAGVEWAARERARTS